MLTQISLGSTSETDSRRTSRLWHDEAISPTSIGCTVCPDRPTCGGLSIESALYNCLGFCCGNPHACDVVCRSRPKYFARHVREVSGFNLDNVPRAASVGAPTLPPLVPLLYHRSGRVQSFSGPAAVALPLYKVIHRHGGDPRYRSLSDLALGFGFDPNAAVVLSGTDRDRPLERWWSLGYKRRVIIRALKDLGVAMVTAPNFSLFSDQPRWDDLHSMKRIAITQNEFLDEGLPAALHLNARTNEDWNRWREYIRDRPEVTHVSFEFGTGAGYAGRFEWHTEQLIRLSESVAHPLHLIIRGGTAAFPRLRIAFNGMTILDSTVFMKTIRRQAATLEASGPPVWKSRTTAAGESLDVLLNQNWQAVEKGYLRLERGGEMTVGS